MPRDRRDDPSGFVHRKTRHLGRALVSWIGQAEIRQRKPSLLFPALE
jgi:hypothetical protein